VGEDAYNSHIRFPNPAASSLGLRTLPRLELLRVVRVALLERLAARVALAFGDVLDDLTEDPDSVSAVLRNEVL
jgi:hypothetical protein